MSETIELYPEHAKLAHVRDEVLVCGLFMDWLDEQGLMICEKAHKPYEDFWAPVAETRERLLARRFDVDVRRLDVEKRMMLDALRGPEG